MTAYRGLRLLLQWGLAAAGAALLGAFVALGYVWSIAPQPMLAVAGPSLPPPPVPAGSGWTRFGGDDGATQYSPLSQITAANVGRLEVAWTYHTGEAVRHADTLAHSSFQNTPILAAGSLIVCTPWSRIIALDPATGRERWAFDPHVTMRQTGWQKYMCRGVASWRDPQAAADAPCAERILFGTNDLRLIAIDARDGRPCARFGTGGVVQATVAGGQLFPGEEQFNAPPALVNGVVVLGSMIADNARPDQPHGIVRAWDARTGAPKWTFDPIPTTPGDPAWESWGPDGPAKVGGGNVWADMSVDAARNLVFLPTSAGSASVAGRTGGNAHTTSTVALDAGTGRIVWEQQLVHHDVFDYDAPTSPLLTDLYVRGQTVPAAVQLTKMGLIFVFDRRTGRPVFPVAERPVAQTDLPGTWSAPTQPFPTTMPSLVEPRFTSTMAWGFTFWDKGRCAAALDAARSLGLYGPKSRQGTIVYPWTSGGSNTGSRAYDPQRRLLIATVIKTVGLAVERPGASELAVTHYAGDGGPPVSGVLLSPFGAPCNRPPWGELVALDLERQKVVWRVPLGSIEKMNPLHIPFPFGTPMRGGPIATGGGLVFVAGTMDDAIRAFDTTTGAELWKRYLPAGGQATPMTYMAGGRQYVVIAAGGHAWMGTKPGDAVIAYALK